jgi:hypothetical protein
LAQPESLAVIDQEFHGVPAPASEDKQRPAKRIARQHLSAQARQAVYPFAKIHWFDGQ